MDWNLEELHRAALTLFPVPAHITPDTMAQHTEPEEIEMMLVKGALEVYERGSSSSPRNGWGGRRTFVLLNAVDQLWQRHLTDLDVLREGIGLVGYGGRDPLVEYQRQSYEMWQRFRKKSRRRSPAIFSRGSARSAGAAAPATAACSAVEQCPDWARSMPTAAALQAAPQARSPSLGTSRPARTSAQRGKV